MAQTPRETLHGSTPAWWRPRSARAAWPAAPWARSAGESAYCATKHAVRGFTEGIAEEGRLHGIRVHAVFPAGVDTAFWSSASQTPMSRETLDIFLRPEDVARTIVDALSAPPYLQTQMAVVRSLQDADLEHIRRRMARFETAPGA